MSTENLPVPLQVTLHLSEIFERLNIPYFIGGSVASSVVGEPRSTDDVDIVIQIDRTRTIKLIPELQGDFYLNEDTIRNSVENGRSFNIIHFATAQKIDLFPSGMGPFDVEQMKRRKKARIAGQAGPELYIATAEDVLLRKLEWYRKGGEVSDRQWRDILGIIRVQKERLDLSYTRNWAESLKIVDLLSRALSEVKE
jgi:hypothetical protein